jgi:hypothetical protein
MLGQQNPTGGSIESLIHVSKEAQTALVEALDQDTQAPRSLRLYFQGHG